jgi:hypothetical protein
VIVSGNGHIYLVRYDESLVDSRVAVEWVPRRLMRPLALMWLIIYVGLWVLGSILEAFDSYSWKVEEVVRVLGNKTDFIGCCIQHRIWKMKNGSPL